METCLCPFYGVKKFDHHKKIFSTVILMVHVEHELLQSLSTSVSSPNMHGPLNMTEVVIGLELNLRRL